MVKIQELNNVIDWLHKFSASDAISTPSRGYTSKSKKLAKQGRENIKTIQLARQEIDWDESKVRPPIRLNKIDDLIFTLTVKLNDIENDREVSDSINKEINQLIRIVSSMTNELVRKKEVY
jgi:hypothetical protein